MKKQYSVLLLFLFQLSCGSVSAQGRMTISGGASVTVNGNTTIISCTPSAPSSGLHVALQSQIIWNWNAVADAAGYKWNTSDDFFTAQDLGSEITKSETGLSCNTSYKRYVWAYNACGHSPAAELQDTTTACGWFCGMPITDSRDGKVYSTVQIYTQCWMAQNLNYGTRINGSVQQTNNDIVEKYCYSNEESNCDVYGGLYQWAETVQYLNGASNSYDWYPRPTGPVQGICPSGWHLPTNDEFDLLDANLGGWYGSSGGKLKEAGFVHWQSPNAGATNESNFTGLPGGWYEVYPYNAFMGQQYYARFWTSTPYYSYVNESRYWALNYNDVHFDFGIYDKACSFSVRCMKD
jgi:uncharacterized protein (TIGR02145 family)